MWLYTYFITKFLLKNNVCFVWSSNNQTINSFKKINFLPIELLIGIDNQKSLLLSNTANFAKNNYTNNALLWGARGSGKSTLIKSVFYNISKQYDNLRLLQINKDNIPDLENIYKFAKDNNKYRFILYIDDLSFEKLDDTYKIIKSKLDGSIQNQPRNLIIYTTSNRRHLMSKDMIDNERSSAIHTDENIEEKISLSDRFGLWIGFHQISQDIYLEMISSYSKYFKIPIDEKLKRESLQWSIQRGNRNGRTAWQFILNKNAENNLQIKY
ncbi:MAG: hypothetical protein CFH19_00450 [Alphaproteobacteria bacterium MarineAlpha5_Bin9]|nr:MAG: hypothetical protein CFH19_00450 [Alphaproteobacteria bacterium MarineAlpha5_Bin9]|tara:strand:- start:22881 stop:23687 length:807 start_codon:yes stop_codon:yes gene_type:complete